MTQRPGPGRPRPDPRYTFMVVADAGRGQPLQWTLPRRRLRAALAGTSLTLGFLVLAAVVQVATFSRVRDHDALVVQNLELKAEVEGVRHQLEELAPVIQRVRAYDEQLRGLAAAGSLPGFGPLDADAMASRDAWMSGVVGGDGGRSTPSALSLFTELAEIDLDALDDNLARLQRSTEAMPQLWPVEGQVTSGFGWRRDPFGRARWKFHGGLDIGADYGSAILATGGGTVVFVGWHSGHGRMVEIDHGGGITTRYCHASQLLAVEGEEVLAGQTVALVGSSGMSTGPHLHYELVINDEKVDPRLYLPSLER
jgi:murein DD-endopeptidase MepM/ murein hydrolase activator NlpD